MAIVNTKKSPLSSEITSYVSRMTSLANDAAKVLATISFDSINSPADVLFHLETKTGASGVDTVSGAYEFYLLSKMGTDDWTDGIDPTTDTDIAASLKDAVHIKPTKANANALAIDIYRYLSSIIGPIPDQVAIVIKNLTGAASDSVAGSHTFSAWKMEPESS